MNPDSVFLDSAFYVALIDPRDRFRAAATELNQFFRPPSAMKLVTSEAVLVEILNFFSRRGEIYRSLARDFVENALGDTHILVETMPTQLLRDALGFYGSREDKNYSLTDCISMLICRRLGIRQVATSDHGFEQEGFEILLPAP